MLKISPQLQRNLVKQAGIFQSAGQGLDWASGHAGRILGDLLLGRSSLKHLQKTKFPAVDAARQTVQAVPMSSAQQAMVHAGGSGLALGAGGTALAFTGSDLLDYLRNKAQSGAMDVATALKPGRSAPPPQPQGQMRLNVKQGQAVEAELRDRCFRFSRKATKTALDVACERLIANQLQP